jgi:hypothetical protein
MDIRRRKKYTLLHAYSKYFFVSNHANIMPQERISSVVAKLSSQTALHLNAEIIRQGDGS